MSLASLLDTPCTLIRRADTGSTDAYGNPTQTETLVNTTCSLQQSRRSEEGNTGEVSETIWALVLPTATAIDTGDRALVGGAFYEVVGQPWDATEGSSAVRHVEATVLKVAGAEDAS